MPWVRIDDHFDEHVKFARVGPLGIALWVTGLAYCNRNLTDGFIPWTVARRLLSWQFLGADDGNERGRKIFKIAVTSGMAGDDIDSEFVTNLLIEAGLWEHAEDGYQVHDYHIYQPSREETLAHRDDVSAAHAAAGALGGRRSGEVRREQSHQRNEANAKQTRSKAEANSEAKPEANAKQKGTPVPGPVPGEESDSVVSSETTGPNGPPASMVDMLETLLDRCADPKVKNKNGVVIDAFRAVLGKDELARYPLNGGRIGQLAGQCNGQSALIRLIFQYGPVWVQAGRRGDPMDYVTKAVSNQNGRANGRSPPSNPYLTAEQLAEKARLDQEQLAEFVAQDQAKWKH